MSKITLEEYLRKNVKNNVIDFSIRASVAVDGRIVFYIHPQNESGETADFEVSGNKLKSNRDIVKAEKNLCKAKKDLFKNTPKNLEQCFEALDKMPKLISEMKNGSEKDMCMYHFGLGMWIRNNWGLWDKNSELYKFFEKIGLWHADDMSSMILDSYYRKLNNIPLELDKQIAVYLNYWAKEKNVAINENIS